MPLPALPTDQPIHVIIAIQNTYGISGATSWALLVRKWLHHDPRFKVRLLTCLDQSTRDESLGEISAGDRDDLFRLLRRMAPAIVIPNWLFDLMPVCARLIADGVDIRCLGICHADTAEEYFNPLTSYAQIFSHFMAVSPECADGLKDRLPARSVDISVLPCGVEVPATLRRDYQVAPLRLVYGGRVVQKQKRVMDFPILVRALLDRKIDFVFDIVGGGPNLEALKRAMASIEHGERVRFHARLPSDRMPAVWREHDVFLQVSEFEGTSVSMLEAMAQGTVPVVTQTSSGILGVLSNGNNGFYSPVGKMAAMAEILGRLAADRTTLEWVGCKARDWVRCRFSFGSHIQRLTGILETVAGSPTPEGLAGRSFPEWPHRHF